ncbi:MAG: YezD family protein [Verrucomicrobiae bacterium]|nr:YezD family protein [Verrucomicrobiae bacterium]
MDKRVVTQGVGESQSVPVWLNAVRLQVESLRFGQVQIVVHDGRVVQIEKVEKIRIESRLGSGE